MEDFNLIELHQHLNDFAKYHHNKGGQAAHQIIKKRLIDDAKQMPYDGSKEGMLLIEGYDRAIKDVLTLLHLTFVP
jgi:hypothetical protein